MTLSSRFVLHLCFKQVHLLLTEKTPKTERYQMGENYRNKTGNKQIATEDKLWIPPLSPKEQKKLAHLHQKNGKRSPPKWTGFSGKTLWDWLQLLGVLAIPLVVVGATILFGMQQANLAQQQHESDQKIANQQFEANKQSALDQQQATILQTYIDDIQDLLLNHNPLKSQPTGDVAILARARTLTALRGLDSKRKGFLVQFIYEAGLISVRDNNGKRYGPVINLYQSDLTNADLSGAGLWEANLRGADLSGANLRGANLFAANLSSPFPSFYEATDLSGANLSGANLRDANLSGANLSGANLRGADLSGADLSGADLSGANFYHTDFGFGSANLTNADLSGADLTYEYYLTQQQLDRVFTCKGAILPKGLRCNAT